MSKLHCDISMSLDGFITGPDEGVEKPLGDDAGAAPRLDVRRKDRR
jgi:hypothetical protein